jgi:hypothetical protein
MERTCNKCGKTKPIDEFLRKGCSYSFLDIYLQILERGGYTSAFVLTCADCRETITKTTERKKKAKKERSDNIRRMMGYLKDDERSDWKYHNRYGLQIIGRVTNNRAYNQMYWNKNVRKLVEAQTIQIKLINLIKDQENERCDNSQK